MVLIMVFLKFLLVRFIELLAAPFINPKMLWIALPLIITLIAVELYFGRYKDEKLGWNTALTNALVLVFVSLNLFQHVFTNYPGGFFRVMISTGFFVALAIFLMGIALFFSDFSHLFPKKLAFVLSSHLPVNLTAYTAIAVVYNNIPVDLTTIVSWLLLILIIAGVLFLIKKLEHRVIGEFDSEDDLEDLKTKDLKT
jgi:hypothetical protein